MVTTRHRTPRSGKPIATAAVAAVGLLLAACGGAPGQQGSTQPTSSEPAPPVSSESEEPSSPPAAEPTAMRVTLDWVADASYAGVYVAHDAGFYTEEGIDLEVIPGGPNAPVAEQNIAGENAEIAFTSNIFRLFSAIQGGQDLVLIGTQFQESPAGLLSLADRPVRTPEEVEGARILAGENSRPIIAATMDVIGVQDYEFVPSGGGIDPLLQGEGHALWAFESTQPVTLTHQFDMVAGTDFHFVTAASLGTPSYANILIADREFAENNRDLVVAFLKGTIRGWQAQLDDPGLGADLTVDVYGASLGLDRAVVVDQLAILESYIVSEDTETHGLLWIDPGKVGGPIYAALTAFGMTDLPDVNRVVDTSYLEQAYQELAQEG